MLDEYQQGERVTDIFPINVLGFQTHRDDFAISFDQDEMKAKLKVFADPNTIDTELEARYGLKSNRDWPFLDAPKSGASRSRYRRRGRYPLFMDRDS